MLACDPPACDPPDLSGGLEVVAELDRGRGLVSLVERPEFGGQSVQVWGDPDELIRKLTRWASYFFEEFLPWIGNALIRPEDGSPDRLGPLSVTCPECGTAFVGRRGEVGRPVQSGGG